MSAEGTTTAELIALTEPSDDVLWLCWWLARYDRPLEATEATRQVEGRYPGRWAAIMGEALDRRLVTLGASAEVTAYGLIAAQDWADTAGCARLEAMA